MPAPRLSIVVIFHDMAREAPRTLHTLTPAYQRGIGPGDYEVIAVDHGSAVPLERSLVEACGPNFRLVTHPPAAPPSPVRAINEAVRASQGEAVAVCIDGARMLSPGILRLTLQALDAFADPAVATLSWHLGPKVQNRSLLEGYDQAAEDRLLATIDWRRDGYELFTVSTLAASSGTGWFLPIAESNCLTMRRTAYERLGGLDEGFAAAGGGLAILDFYKRACETLADLVILLGEGTFHQFHGGVATNVPEERHPIPVFAEEYLRLRGAPFSPPTRSASYIGAVPRQCLPFLALSAERAVARMPAAGAGS